MDPRLPLLHPASLDPAQRLVYDQVTGGRRAEGPRLFAMTDEDGALRGPFNAMLHAPAVGGSLGQLGEAIRFRSSLDDRIREIAILTVASHHRSDFEWYAHEHLGKHAGLTEAEIGCIRRLAPLDGASPADVVAYDFCRTALRDQEIADSLHDLAVEQFGQMAVVELVMLVGYYQALALMLSVFRVPSPDDVTWPDRSSTG